MAKTCLTARGTSRAEAVKAGHSDPITHDGLVIAQRIKDTVGITGYSPFRVPIDEGVRHLDVG